MKKILFLSLLLLHSIFVSSQNEKPEIINNQFEQVIIHTDRDIYLNKEKIWFTAYCFISKKEISHNLSNVLYIELYNNSQSLIVKKKFKIINGKVDGAIDIPSEFISGNYSLRAYTQFLKNFSPKTYFTKLISIINPLKNLPEQTKSYNDNIIEIIPSGGILLNGIKSKIAFKIKKELIPQIKAIVITDKEYIEITNPSFSENGFGLFEYKPDSSANGYIKLILNDKDFIIQSIPKKSAEGILIKTTRASTNTLRIDLFNNFAKTNANYQLEIVSQNAKTVFNEQIKLVNELTTITIPYNKLSKGINYIILKNNSNEIIKTHAFYKKSKSIKIDINTSKNTYSPRELINLKLSTSDTYNSELKNISVAVVKKGSSNKVNRINRSILKNPQHLSSFLRDLNNTHSLNQEQLEILMIYYNQLLLKDKTLFRLEKNINEIPWVPEIREVSLSGIVYSKDNKTPIPNVPVYVSAFNENPQIHIYETTDKGEFVFSLNNLIMHQDLFISTKTNLDKNIEIRINNDFLYDFPETDISPLIIDTTYKSLLKEMFINTQTNTAFDTKMNTVLDPSFKLPFTFNDPQETYYMDDYVSFVSFEEFLREIISCVRVNKRKGSFNLKVVNKNEVYSSPLILIDNIPAFDVDEVMKIPVSVIEKVEIHKKPIVINSIQIDGIIMITTKTENFGGFKTPENSIFLKYQTIAENVQFDSPEYDTKDKQLNRAADFRTVLYWNPQIKMSTNAKVSFYSSNHCSAYDIIVRGYTEDGKECFGTTTINVVSTK